MGKSGSCGASPSTDLTPQLLQIRHGKDLYRLAKSYPVSEYKNMVSKLAVRIR